VWTILAATVSDWYEDNAQRSGAALAFYTIFALAPGLIIVIAVAGLVLGEDAARGQILDQIRDLIGQQGAKAVEATIVSAHEQSLGVVGTVLTIIPLVFALWGVFGELQDALNTIWGVRPKPGRTVLEIFKERFWSFAMVVGIGFLLLVSLAISACVAALGTSFGELLPAPAPALEAANFVLSVGVITILFAVTFKLLPDVTIAWKDVWLGAAVTSFLFTVGKFLIGLYLGKSSVASAYGAAGSLVIIVIWVYYSAQILLLGAEFTKVWTKRRGSGFAPKPTAVPVTDEAR
jgi:membrane protein